MNEVNAAMNTGPDPFLIYPDERFQAVAEPASVTPDLLAVGQDLLSAARSANAYGLAAVHIGVVAPVVVISLGDPATRDYRVLYNPRIVRTSGDSALGKEGSVSMPGVEVDIARPERVHIAFENETGAPTELELTGFPARVAQHEIDQVNGVYFLTRLSRLKREAAIKRFAKRARRMG